MKLIFNGCLLFFCLLLFSCEKQQKNPLRQLREGLWVPVAGSIPQVSTQLIDAPDSIRYFTPPLWLLGKDKNILTAKNRIFFDYNVVQKNGKWQIGHYHCELDISKSKDTLYCGFVDTDNKKQVVKYIHKLAVTESVKALRWEDISRTTWWIQSDDFDFNFVEFQDGDQDSKNNFIILAEFKDSVNQVIENKNLTQHSKLLDFKEYNGLFFLTIDPLFQNQSFVIREVNTQMDRLVLIPLVQGTMVDNEECIWTKVVPHN